MSKKESDDNIIKLRQKIKEAIELGLVSSDSIFEGTLINLYNQCKAGEERCKTIAAEHEKRVSQAKAQASAYSQMTSIVYGTLSGFISGAHKDEFELEPQDDDLTDEERVEEEAFRNKILAKEKRLKEAAAARASMVKAASKISKDINTANEKKPIKNTASKKTAKKTSKVSTSAESSTKKASNKKASKKKTTRRRR